MVTLCPPLQQCCFPSPWMAQILRAPIVVAMARPPCHATHVAHHLSTPVTWPSHTMRRSCLSHRNRNGVTAACRTNPQSIAPAARSPRSYHHIACMLRLHVDPTACGVLGKRRFLHLASAARCKHPSPRAVPDCRPRGVPPQAPACAPPCLGVRGPSPQTSISFPFRPRCLAFLHLPRTATIAEVRPCAIAPRASVVARLAKSPAQQRATKHCRTCRTSFQRRKCLAPVEPCGIFHAALIYPDGRGVDIHPAF